jgi:hypothetical protein
VRVTAASFAQGLGLTLTLMTVGCGVVADLAGSPPADCRAPVASGGFRVPAHTSYVRWDFGSARLSAIEYDLYIDNDPGTEVGLYVGLASSEIDGTSFYLGIQTNVNRPSVGGVGKGFIFSRWETLDAADGRVAAGGFMEQGTHEGRFVGVRRPYEWQAGTEYTLRLSRGAQDGPADWYDLTLIERPSGDQVDLGGLRFPRRDKAHPATIKPRSTTFTEVYSGAGDYSEVPRWRLATRARGDGVPALSARSEYPAFPFAEYPNTDVYYDEVEDWVHMIYGADTARCHPSDKLY